MLTLVSDIDVMAHYSNQLAIPRGHPPPTQLPAEFSNYVKVCEIVDSHLPGYVYLTLRYLLTECIDNDSYRHFTYDNGWYLSRECSSTSKKESIHGPARCRNNSDIPLFLSIDQVICVRCLLWPWQAADWPTRQRNYDWPNSTIIDCAVSHRCDMVQVALPLCRQDEWMSTYQWRLSFSWAEIVLLNSWMPVLQIVYHMLGALWRLN